MNKTLSSFLLALLIYVLFVAIFIYSINTYNTNEDTTKFKKLDSFPFSVISVDELRVEPKPKIRIKPEITKESYKKTESRQKRTKPHMAESLIIPDITKREVEKETEEYRQKTVPRTVTDDVAPYMPPEKVSVKPMVNPKVLPVEKKKRQNAKKKPEKTRKPEIQTIKKIDKKPVKIIEKKQKRQKQRSSYRQSSRGQSGTVSKNRFLAKIKRRINRNKSYPRLASRRRMQGTVRVKFTISEKGNVGNIRVNGPKVFHKSAEKAVRKAFPINTSKTPFRLPKTISLSIRYKLR